MRRHWMAALCEPARRSAATPFSVEMHGTSWDVATNGHAILFVPGATWPERDDRPKVEALGEPTAIEESLPVPSVLVDWACGEAEACPKCHGTGLVKLCCYNPESGDPYEGSGCCAKCKGGGIPYMQPATVDGVWINRRLLYVFLLPALAHLPGRIERMGWTPSDERNQSRLALHGAGWVLQVMPLRQDEVHEPERCELLREGD